MKRYILAAALALTASHLTVFSASAADIGPPMSIASPIPNAADYKRSTWTGPYIEFGAGMTVGQIEATNGLDSVSISDAAMVGHIGIGYDYAMGNIVVGIFGRAELDELTHKSGGLKLADTDISYTAAGRIGYVPRNDAMLYVLAGVEWSNLDVAADLGSDVHRFGWVLGTGIELMMTDNIGVGLEYTATIYGGESIEGASIDTTDHSGRARLLLKF